MYELLHAEVKSDETAELNYTRKKETKDAIFSPTFKLNSIPYSMHFTISGKAT